MLILAERRGNPPAANKQIIAYGRELTNPEFVCYELDYIGEDKRMKIKPPKITLDAFEIFGNEGLEAELDQQETAFKNAWKGVYNAIADGGHKIAYWDGYKVEKPEYTSFMRYALHRSTKKDGFLQLSVMEIRNDEMIPTSDSQHDSAEDFIERRAWTCGANTVTLL